MKTDWLFHEKLWALKRHKTWPKGYWSSKIQKNTFLIIHSFKLNAYVWALNQIPYFPLSVHCGGMQGFVDWWKTITPVNQANQSDTTSRGRNYSRNEELILLILNYHLGFLSSLCLYWVCSVRLGSGMLIRCSFCTEVRCRIASRKRYPSKGKMIHDDSFSPWQH